ncbi:hypothetical protein [Flavobacterium beibuense]|uniref:hypothetical protein n=1 Tax=Flavobacterium beibuense TaxID=657326 RepID=UPI003A91C941
MQVQTIAASFGLEDIKLTAQNEQERNLLIALANAGTLTCITTEVGKSVVFRAQSIMEEDYVSSSVSNSSSIGTYNFEMRQNEYHFFTLNFSANGGDLMDLSIYESILLQVKKHKHGTPIISLDLESGLELNPEQTSQLKVLFSADQTEKLTLQQYYYDVLFKNQTENKYYLEGEIIIKQSVTR